MSELPRAFFHRDGDTFVPTALTIGPWDPGAQHGGPPAALLGRAFEAFGDDPEAWSLVRFSGELLRPVPLSACTVEVSALRQGREAEWLEGRLVADGKVRLMARGLRIRRVPVELPPPHTPALSAPSVKPEEREPFTFPFFRVPVGYHRAVELRIVEGEWGMGPVTTWMRLLAPLVDGEADTSWSRVLTMADAANGIVPALTTGDFAFINADLTVHLERPFTGEWLAFAGRSRALPRGVGRVDATLFDEAGEIGRVQESLVVRKLR